MLVFLVWERNWGEIEVFVYLNQIYVIYVYIMFCYIIIRMQIFCIFFFFVRSGINNFKKNEKKIERIMIVCGCFFILDIVVFVIVFIY